MAVGNRISKAISEKGRAIGTWAQMNSPEFCEIAARSGMDFVIIDMEHGSFGIESAVNMMRAVEANGAAPIVRVPDSAPVNVMKVLDAGAIGVMIPGISSAAQAEAAVKAARYSPLGTRGACPATRATGHGLHEWGEFLQWCDENILVCLLVESVEGIRDFEQIVSVPGVTAVGIGQFDLSQAMGLAGQYRHPDVKNKMMELTALARGKGVEVFNAVFDSEPDVIAAHVSEWQEAGARMFAVSGDRFLISSRMMGIISAVASTGKPSASDAA